VFTGAGDDRILGSGQANFMSTAEGADTVKAADGADIVLGGDGADKLTGGGGADTIHGQGGQDLIRGGFGADVFNYLAATDSPSEFDCDRIRDFSTLQGDLIDLAAVAAGELAFIGGAAFSGAAPEVRVQAHDELQVVEVDIDGDGAHDMYIVILNGGLAGGAADFIL
jgi:Ca2+-binding RTX toxin-like protein